MEIQTMIARLGGPAAVARMCGIKAPSVYGWKEIPVERCVAIERATGGAVTRKDLRPNDWQDIWPELLDKQAEQAA